MFDVIKKIIIKAFTRAIEILTRNGRPAKKSKPIVRAEKILQNHSKPVKVEKIPAQSSPPKKEVLIGKFVLDIKNADEMERYSAKLNDLRGFEEFCDLKWVSVRLDRINKILLGVASLNDFDNAGFNFNLAEKVRDVAKIVLEIYNYAKSSTELNENSRGRLTRLAEDYLATIGLTKKFFEVGDDFDDWADLNMKDSYEIVSTKNPDETGKIAAIEIQPHILCYRGEFGDVEQLTFGGLCRVHKFRED